MCARVRACGGWACGVCVCARACVRVVGGCVRVVGGWVGVCVLAGVRLIDPHLYTMNICVCDNGCVVLDNIYVGLRCVLTLELLVAIKIV